MNRELVLPIWVVGLLSVAVQPAYGGALVAHWSLDGNAADSSGNLNNGTPYGDVTYVPGVYGQAAQFDGNGDYLRILNNPGIQLLAGAEFTVAAFVNTPSKGHQNILIHGLGCSTWASWFLGVEGGEPDASRTPGTFAFGVRSTGGSPYTGVFAGVIVNEWVHLAATHDGAKLHLFVNGEERGSVAAPMPFNSQESLHIGGDPGCGGRSWYTGKVDDVYIFSKAMTAAQVKELANGGMPTWVKAQKPNPADGAIGRGYAPVSVDQG